MRRVDSLTVGWLKTGLRHLIENGIGQLNEISFSLITSIDSATRLASEGVGRKIVERYPGCKFLGDGIVVPHGLLLEIHRSLGLFHGFDEVWFFDVEPLLQKPNDIWLVGPLNLDFEELPPSVAQWMSESACKLGLGDGVGLNFVSADEEIARELDRGSNRA